MLSGRNASGQIQIAASQNRFYPLALKMVTRSEGEFYRTAVTSILPGPLGTSDMFQYL
jgi:hypothetical protein